jgi:hypothetical protein
MRTIILLLLSLVSLVASPIVGSTVGGKPAAAVELADTSAVEPVPEPTTWLMLTAGILLMGMSILRNRRVGNAKAASVKTSEKIVPER